MPCDLATALRAGFILSPLRAPGRSHRSERGGVKLNYSPSPSKSNFEFAAQGHSSIGQDGDLGVLCTDCDQIGGTVILQSKQFIALGIELGGMMGDCPKPSCGQRREALS